MGAMGAVDTTSSDLAGHVDSADHGRMASAVRRYSRDPRIRRQQEHFDDLQYRVGIDYFAPTMAELAAAKVTKARPICRDYACRHDGAMLDLTSLPPKLRTHTLRKRLVCRRCGLRRPELELIWDGFRI